MDEKSLESPRDLIDKIIYADPKTIPHIDISLIDFLRNNLSNTFPDIVNISRDDLLVHQGKLELVASLEHILNNRQDIDNE